jgi:hypothetical protein
MDQVGHAILRVRAFIGGCQAMSKEQVLAELGKIAEDARQLGMDETADDIAKVTESLRKRYKAGSCQN